jgi:hypothetical protein
MKIAYYYFTTVELLYEKKGAEVGKVERPYDGDKV